MYKYNPRIKPVAPGEALEVEVDLPDNPTNEEVFESMVEAAKLLGLA